MTLGVFYTNIYMEIKKKINFGKPKKQLKSDVIYFAKTNFRSGYRPVGIKESDRFSHIYAIGKTGVGKTTLLKSMIAQDMKNGNGCAVFDPHGDLAEDVIKLVPT